MDGSATLANVAICSLLWGRRNENCNRCHCRTDWYINVEIRQTNFIFFHFCDIFGGVLFCLRDAIESIFPFKMYENVTNFKEFVSCRFHSFWMAYVKNYSKSPAWNSSSYSSFAIFSLCMLIFDIIEMIIDTFCLRHLIMHWIESCCLSFTAVCPYP